MPDNFKKRNSPYKYHGEQCLNCNLPLDKTDNFCPNCGQLNTTKKLSLWVFINEFFSGLFNYDSRFQRTLRVLLFSPGKISKDYINGKRVRYVNPFRFYLSASIIFFLIAGLSDSLEGVNFEETEEGLRNEINKIPQDSILSNDLDQIPALKQNEIQLDSILTNLSTEKTAKTYQDIYVPEKDLDTLNFFEHHAIKLRIFYKFYMETGTNSAQMAMDQLFYEKTKWNYWLYHKAVKFNILYTNPKLFVDYFISKLPFIIFFFLPVFALFIWLLYLRQPFNYMEHLIFAFHVQTTIFVLYIFGYTFDNLLNTGWGFGLANAVFVFYLYKAMRNFYGQGRVKTILKFILLNIIFFTLATIGTFIAVIVSFSIF